MYQIDLASARADHIHDQSVPVTGTYPDSIPVTSIQEHLPGPQPVPGPSGLSQSPVHLQKACRQCLFIPTDLKGQAYFDALIEDARHFGVDDPEELFSFVEYRAMQHAHTVVTRKAKSGGLANVENIGGYYARIAKNFRAQLDDFENSRR